MEKLRETWILPGCKEIVIDSYPGMKEYVEVECYNEQSLKATIKKLNLTIKETGKELSANSMYYKQYGITLNRPTGNDLTVKNAQKVLGKYITKNKAQFTKILKEQQKLLKK